MFASGQDRQRRPKRLAEPEWSSWPQWQEHGLIFSTTVVRGVGVVGREFQNPNRWFEFEVMTLALD